MVVRVQEGTNNLLSITRSRRLVGTRMIRMLLLAVVEGSGGVVEATRRGKGV
jgi:hypothetical protein